MHAAWVPHLASKASAANRAPSGHPNKGLAYDVAICNMLYTCCSRSSMCSHCLTSRTAASNCLAPLKASVHTHAHVQSTPCITYHNKHALDV
eukprot:1160053-Pelagomonas_calceolata.AAC.5